MDIIERLREYKDILYPEAHEAADEIERMQGLLLWALYHHQGGSSQIGQPIRRALGIGQHDALTKDQITRAKAAAGMSPPEVPDDAMEDDGGSRAGACDY